MDIKEKEDKILVVDDDKSVRDFLVRFLKNKGYQQVKAVEMGSQALDIIQKEDIKLVLLDIVLPDMYGMDVLRKIKKINKDIVVIMITGFSDEEKVKESMQEGAYDYIVKPFDLAYLELSVLTKIIPKK